MSTADEQDVFDDVHDLEWSDDADDIVDDDSVEKNCRRDVRFIYIRISFGLRNTKGNKLTYPFVLYLYRVDPGTSSTDEPKFIVFYSMLMTLFSLFCFKCRNDKPSVSMKVYGTMVSVYQQCNHCGQTFDHMAQSTPSTWTVHRWKHTFKFSTL